MDHLEARLARGLVLDAQPAELAVERARVAPPVVHVLVARDVGAAAAAAAAAEPVAAEEAAAADAVDGGPLLA